MRRASLLDDQSGFTLVEQLIAATAGLVVLFAVTAMIMTSLREGARINSRVDATQRARTVLYQVIDGLHSACLAPQIAPVQAGSTPTSLRFLHQTGSAVAPTPILSALTLSGNSLSESVYPSTGGTAPTWTFSGSPSSTRELMTGVAASPPLFRYFSYSSGQISATALPTPLSAADAARTVQVSVALTVSPSSTPIADPNAAASVQDTALLRFSPAAFSTSANNLPCQ